jgi:hypothetical protein
MSASELDQSAPVFDLLAPAGAKAASFGQPAESALNNPAAGRETDFTWDETFFDKWLTTFTLVLDMNDIASLLHKVMNIWKIVASVCAQMLLGSRAGDNNRNNQVVRRPFVMTVSASHQDRQGCTPPVYQYMDFAASFAAIHRAFARICPSQGRWTRFAVDSLPLPFDMTLASIEPHHLLHDRREHPAALPFLKAVMQGAAAHPKPTFIDRFPLTACPQHIPHTIQDCPVISPLAPRLPILINSRKQLPDPTPQRTRYSKIIHIIRFCCSILVQGVFARLSFWPTQSERNTPSFSTPTLIYG